MLNESGFLVEVSEGGLELIWKGFEVSFGVLEKSWYLEFGVVCGMCDCVWLI